MIILFSGNPVFAAFDSLVITEFMAINSEVLQDEDGDYPDWIEIYNPTPDSVDLLNWSLTDNASSPAKWRFPQITIPPGSYMVIFASGKDRTVAGENLHTNFKLSGSGEYLAIYMPDSINPFYSFGSEFPVQYEDISYGEYGGSIIYMATPTPGAPNVDAEFLPPPSVNIHRGFYDQPVNVEISSPVAGSVIYYTTNGDTPSEINGTEYTGPVSISTTTPLRAVTTKGGCVPSTVITHTYFFLEDVAAQPNNPPGYPSQWGDYIDPGLPGNAIADYEMDNEITDHPDYRDILVPSLLSVPTISLVTDISCLFSSSTDPDSGGIYMYTGADGTIGDEWERPVSFEYFVHDPEQRLQVNCGIRIQGGASRRPEKSPKHSFRLVFRSEYGPGRLDFRFFDDEGAASEFNTIIFRAAYGNTWRHFSYIQRIRAQHLRDPWSKDTQLDMAHIAVHNKFAHLYINGLYWGLYNICERYDKDYMESYYGGDESEYDVIKDYLEVMDGNIDSWDILWNTVDNTSIMDNTVYQELIGNNPDGTPNEDYDSYLDPVNLIDYMLINFYGGNNDWDHHNWVAARNRVNPGKGFQFYCWDTEKILENKYENYVNENNDNRPSGIFKNLMKNSEFKLLFADRVNLHFYNGGTLTPEAAIERYMERANEIEQAMISESARWGDYRRDVHQWSEGPFLLYTRNDYWYEERDRLVDDYFRDRTQIVLDQLQNAGMLQSLAAPVFSQHGGIVSEDFRLAITAPLGDIYYTRDGTDPRLIGGDISPGAIIYTDSVIIGKITPVSARAKDGNSWSAITSATFYNDYATTGITDMTAGITGVTIYPNPFSKSATISYNLPVRGDVSVSVFSIDGLLVAEIIAPGCNKGENSLVWEPENMESGIYIIRISCGKYSINSKLLYMKH
jgi:hypothetical protein